MDAVQVLSVDAQAQVHMPARAWDTHGAGTYTPGTGALSMCLSIKAPQTRVGMQGTSMDALRHEHGWMHHRHAHMITNSSTAIGREDA